MINMVKSNLDIRKAYYENRAKYAEIKSSVDHSLSLIEEIEIKKAQDSKKAINKPVRLQVVDEMIYDINHALIKAQEDEDKKLVRNLISRLKNLNNERDEIVKEMDEEYLEKEKKKKESEDEPMEDPEEEKKKKESEDEPMEDPEEDEPMEDPEEEKKKKKKEEGV